MRKISDITPAIQNALTLSEDPELNKRLLSMQEGVLRREVSNSKRPKETIAKPPVKQEQLPLWTDKQRGVPNIIIRSALFPAIQGKTRKNLWRADIAVLQTGHQITFTGKQLDQSDLDVFEQILHICRDDAVGETVVFQERSFLKSLNRSTGSKDRAWLDNVFERLMACLVTITSDDGELYQGGLIYDRARRANGATAVRLNQNILNLFQDNAWTKTDFQQRMALNRSPLALWLHAFYSSHAQPHPMMVKTLHHLSGSEDKHLPAFKRRLTVSLEKLKSIGFLSDFEILNSKVSVTRFRPALAASHA